MFVSRLGKHSVDDTFQSFSSMSRMPQRIGAGCGLKRLSIYGGNKN